MYLERVLFVDLSEQRSWVERFDKEYLSAYLGGVGLGTRLLFDHLKAGVDALSPENVLVFATGAFAGTPISTGSKHAVVSKSPLTGMIGDSLTGSFWSHTLRRAGYDALIVTGRSEKPVYLFIYDDRVQVRSAEHLAGLTTWQTERRLRTELGSDEVRISSIGPAGEHLVRFACVANDEGRMAGRTGMGAVMGSKNLKAVAVRGSGTIRVADLDAMWPMTVDIAKRCQGPMTYKYRDQGTPSNVDFLESLGALPTRNYSATTFEGYQKINGEFLNQHYVERVVACASCAVGCEHIALVKEGPYAGAQTRMDYEPLYAMSSLWGIDDLSATIRAVELAGELGLDAVSAGAVVAWAMECYERGILTKSDFDGLEPNFGNATAALTLMEQIGSRVGIGDLLAEGTKRAAQSVGQNSLDFAMQVKGMEMAGYDPRALKTMGLSYAIGARGACHNRSPGYSPDTQNQVDRLKGGPERGPIVVDIEDKAAVFDSIVLCKFIRAIFEDFYAEASDMYRIVTGIEKSPEEFARTGERISNLKKAFNIREGWQMSDDWLPARAMRDAMPSGPGEGVHMTDYELRIMIDSYYDARGWTGEGLIPKAKLEELGLGDIAEVVEV